MNQSTENLLRKMAISLIVCIFTLLKLVYIREIPMWFDEGLTYFYVQAGNLGEFIYRITLYEQNPLFFYWVCWKTVHLLHSYSLQTMRAIPFFFSLLAPVVLYFLYLECFGEKRGAIIASLLLFTSSFYTWQTCDARGYAMAILFIETGLLFYFRLLRREKMALLLFSLSWIAAIHTHFLSLIILFMIVIHYILFNRGAGNREFFAGCALVALGILPLIWEWPLVTTDPLFLPGFAQWRHIPEWLYVSLIGYTLEFSRMYVWYALCLMSLALVAAPLFIREIPRQNVILFVAIMLGLFLSIFFASKVLLKPIFAIRHMVLVLPLYLSLISLTLSSIHSRWIRAALITFIILLNFTSTFNIIAKPQFQRNDFRTAAEILRSHMKEGDGIVLSNGYQKFMLFYYMPELKEKDLIAVERGNRATISIKDLSRFKTVWLVLSDQEMADPLRRVDTLIAQHYSPKEIGMIKRKNQEFSIEIYRCVPRDTR